MLFSTYVSRGSNLISKNLPRYLNTCHSHITFNFHSQYSSLILNKLIKDGSHLMKVRKKEKRVHILLLINQRVVLFHCSQVQLEVSSVFASPVPEMTEFCRVQPQPQSNTPEAADRGIQVNLTGRCVCRILQSYTNTVLHYDFPQLFAFYSQGKATLGLSNCRLLMLTVAVAVFNPHCGAKGIQ